MRLVDLSQPWSAETPPYPGHPRPLVRSFQNLIQHRVETYLIETTMHTGTHIDAPKHMAPAGKDVASLTLEDLCGTALIIDLAGQVGRLDLLTPELVKGALQAMGEAIRPGDIVIFHTGWQARYGPLGQTPDLEQQFLLHPGPSNDLVDWLVERRVKWVGQDAPSFEHPLNIYLKNLRPDIVASWERETGLKADSVFPPDRWLYSHRTFGEANIPHVDQLGGEIARVAGQRLEVGCFPWRFVGGEACIARVVAFLPE